MTIDLEAPVRALDGPEYIEVDGELVPNYEPTIPIFDEGDVLSGRVVRVDKDEVLIDVGYKSEGVIPIAELSIRKSVMPDDEVELGEMVDALVMQKEDPDGRLILSKKRARFEKAWKRIEAAAADGQHVEGTVIEVVKGGLILDLGVRGFLPASLVDIRRVQDLDEFLGRQLECKVIELNRNRNNVVLSRRAVLEDERREVRQRILDELQPGQVVDGVISNIVDFGAFVDLDGIDGLIHISELSWSHVNHPSEVLEIGQDVNVKVLDIDRERQRISLGLKQTQADPWQDVIESYNVEDVVEGRVTKVVTFGAFIEIHAGVEGLVHISELAAHHVENPREVVNQGDILAVRIIEIDADRRRLSLSLKRVADSDVIQHRLSPELAAAAVAEADRLRAAEAAAEAAETEAIEEDAEALVEAVEDGAEIIAEAVADEAEVAVEAVEVEAEAIAETVVDEAEAIAEAVEDEAEVVAEAVVEEAEAVAEAVVAEAEAVVEAVEVEAEVAIEAAGDDQATVAAIEDEAEATIEAVEAEAEAIVEVVAEEAEVIVEAVAEDAAAAIEVVAEEAEAVVEAVEDEAEAVVEAVEDEAEAIVEAVEDEAEAAIEAVEAEAEAETKPADSEPAGDAG